MTVYVSLDDTDMPDSPGTGRLARDLFSLLEQRYQLLGITRHQLYVHPDIPYTSHNSAAVIHIHTVLHEEQDALFDEIARFVRSRAARGSDPGICMAIHESVTPALILFGKEAKSTILTQDQAMTLALHTKVRLAGLNGTKGGIIGALAAVGLAASGSDGRYIQVGKIRTLRGKAVISVIHDAGIPAVYSIDGKAIDSGEVRFRKFPQPMRINHCPVLFVREDQGSLIVERRD
ncbi:ABC transporter substrate-binding protein [Methanospirillum hungatei]|uniref:ABC transporter substrate-binding protein n=1 Tax=Methanospirillum hungatei TaxID=2203 RepID=UPI0026EA0142|nr:ABC transporter substrate-binding protein [Methanospirillum hungatei]MCA1916646.1 ABC transporter substrate-binding protein [Methanospirillum hungatei]